jgi:hypothetical protein
VEDVSEGRTNFPVHVIHALINHAYYDMARLKCPSILEARYFSEFEPGSMCDSADELNDLSKILS